MKTQAQQNAETLKHDLALNFIANPSNIVITYLNAQLVFVTVIIEHRNDPDDVYTILVTDNGYHCIDTHTVFVEEWEVIDWFSEEA